MNRAIKILEKINDELITDIGDMSIDYGYKEERTFEQQAEILALVQFSERIETTIKELRDYQVRVSQGGVL